MTCAYDGRRYAMVLDGELRLMRDCGPARPLVDALSYYARSAGLQVRYSTPYRRRPDLPSLASFSAACALLCDGDESALGPGRAAARRVVQDVLDMRAVAEVMEW